MHHFFFVPSILLRRMPFFPYGFPLFFVFLLSSPLIIAMSFDHPLCEHCFLVYLLLENAILNPGSLHCALPFLLLVTPRSTTRLELRNNTKYDQLTRQDLSSPSPFQSICGSTSTVTAVSALAATFLHARLSVPFLFLSTTVLLLTLHPALFRLLCLLQIASIFLVLCRLFAAVLMSL